MYRVSVIYGDGIGPYIVDKALGLLTWLGDVAGFRMEFVETPAGDRVLDETGHALPDDSSEKSRPAMPVLKAPWVRQPAT